MSLKNGQTASGTFEFTQSRFILCEGPDDKAFLQRLLKGRQGIPPFQVRHAAECNAKNTGGRSGFIQALKGFPALTGFEDVRAIVLVTDNDEISKAFRETCKTITKNGHIAPSTPGLVGSLLDRPIAIRMIPNWDREGDLESLCLPVLLEKWPKARICMPRFLKCTGAEKWARKGSLNKAKARSIIVGFNQDDPYMGIGYLFDKKILSVDHEAFNNLAAYFRDFDGFVGI